MTPDELRIIGEHLKGIPHPDAKTVGNLHLVVAELAEEVERQAETIREIQKKLGILSAFSQERKNHAV